MGFEVVDFVQTTRRWYDRGDPRDAGENGRLPKPAQQGSRYDLLPLPFSVVCVLVCVKSPPAPSVSACSVL